MLDRIHGKRCTPLVIVNTCLIFRTIEEGIDEEAIALLKRLLQKNLVPDAVAYSLITFSKLKAGDIESALVLNEQMIRRGFDPNAFPLYTKFIGANCQDGQVEEANRLMLEMQNLGLRPYAETYELIIEGLAEVGRIEESLLYCQKMSDAGLIPNRPVFNMMAAKLSKMGEAKETELLTLLIERGFLPYKTAYSLLISCFGQEGEAEEAIKLYHEVRFRKLTCESLSIIRALIKSLCRSRQLGEAKKYHRIMKGNSSSKDVASCRKAITRL